MAKRPRLEKHEAQKREIIRERWKDWIEGLRRRYLQQERTRRRRWLLALLLALLEFKPRQAFLAVHFAETYAPQPKRQTRWPSKSEDKYETTDSRTDDERRFLYDYSPRHGEDGQEIYDGLTWADIIEYNKIHRPHLFPKFVPIPGMPKRYSSEPVHIWTLLFEIQYPHARRDAIAALKLKVDPKAHAWIDACSANDDGWKDLRRCRRRTPDMTIFEFPRAAARWEAEQIRESRERNHAPEDGDDFRP